MNILLLQLTSLDSQHRNWHTVYAKTEGYQETGKYNSLARFELSSNGYKNLRSQALEDSVNSYRRVKLLITCQYEELLSSFLHFTIVPGARPKLIPLLSTASTKPLPSTTRSKGPSGATNKNNFLNEYRPH